MNLYVGISLFITIIFHVWFLFCANKTKIDRINLLHIVYCDDDWVNLSNEFKKVSLEKHLFRKILFQDPIKLYSKKIQDKFLEK